MTEEQIRKHNRKYKRDMIVFWVCIALFNLAIILL